MDGHDSLSERPDPTRPPSLFLSLIDQLPDPNATQILKCEDTAAPSFFRPAACAGGGRVGAPAGHRRFAVGVFPHPRVTVRIRPAAAAAHH